MSANAVMPSLRGKRVLVTGAGRGLGRALAIHFARAGAEIVVTDRDTEPAAAGACELRAAGHAAAAHTVDVTDAAAVRALRDRLRAEGRPIDVLVNNAGVVFGGSFADVPWERHQATVDVNLLGTLAMTHAFLPDLIDRPEAHVVNIVSASALLALPFAVSYAASKWAVLGFSDSLREELRLQGRRHVGVTAVCPSYIATGLFAGARPARLTWWLSADGVAAATVRAVERRRELVLLPWTARVGLGMSRWLPRPVFHRLCAWVGVTTSMAEWRGHG